VSGLAGVYAPHGRPVDVTLLRKMTAAVAHRGPDGEGYWTDGPAGLGHRISRTTPESLGEKQPLLDESETLCLMLDGRVDNRLVGDGGTPARVAPHVRDRRLVDRQLDRVQDDLRGRLRDLERDGLLAREGERRQVGLEP
jgi:hypothetical protein